MKDILIQLALLIACQPQGTGVVTLIDPEPKPAGNDCERGEMIGAAPVDILFVTDAVLLPGTGSGVRELTATVLITLLPLGARQSTLALMVIVVEAPGSSLSREKVCKLPDPKQDVQLLKIRPGGSMSKPKTENAGSELLLVILMSYLTEPFNAPVGVAVSDTDKSA
jgi:hypothetical protein